MPMEATRDTGVFVNIYIYNANTLPQCKIFERVVFMQNHHFVFHPETLVQFHFAHLLISLNALQEYQITFVHNRANPHIPQA